MAVNSTESATVKLLDGATTLGPGTVWFPVTTHRTYHVILTGVVTVEIQVTNNINTDHVGDVQGNNWVTLATIASSASCGGNEGFQNISSWKATRAVVTSIAVGAATVILGT